MPSRIFKQPNPLLWLNVLSLDAPLVALVWQDFFARTFSVKLDAAPRLLLALATWLIYAADRWVDGWKIPRGALITPRHRFAREHRVLLACACALVFCLAAMLAWFTLPVEIFERGSLLAFAVAIYFLLNQWPQINPCLRGLKEFAVGILFAAGTVVSIMPRPGFSASLFGWAWAAWCLLVVLNCYAIGCWEIKTDRAAQQVSLVTRWPFLAGRFRGAAVCVAVFALMPLLLRSSVTMARFGFAVAASSVALGMLDFWNDALDPDFLRTAADLALFTPLLFRFF